jgi:hypothetical protein
MWSMLGKLLLALGVRQSSDALWHAWKQQYSLSFEASEDSFRQSIFQTNL